MKCIDDGMIYTSNPPQYRCRYCGRFWFRHEPAPECSGANTETTSGKVDFKDGYNKLLNSKTK